MEVWLRRDGEFCNAADIVLTDVRSRRIDQERAAVINCSANNGRSQTRNRVLVDVIAVLSVSIGVSLSTSLMLAAGCSTLLAFAKLAHQHQSKGPMPPTHAFHQSAPISAIIVVSK